MLLFLIIITYFKTVTNFKIPVQNAPLPPEFGPHIDLLKVDEIMFRDQIYRVLKPTIHEVKDHFFEVMTRQEQPKSKGKVFIDKNGFRHTWTGYEEEVKYLKPTPLMKISPEVEQQMEKFNVLRAKTTAKPHAATTKHQAATTAKHKDATTAKHNAATTANPHGHASPSPFSKGDYIQTSFYCPFFGIMTMLTKVE